MPSLNKVMLFTYDKCYIDMSILCLCSYLFFDGRHWLTIKLRKHIVDIKYLYGQVSSKICSPLLSTSMIIQTLELDKYRFTIV